jgi:hypothetical protein
MERNLHIVEQSVNSHVPDYRVRSGQDQPDAEEK